MRVSGWSRRGAPAASSISPEQLGAKRGARRSEAHQSYRTHLINEGSSRNMRSRLARAAQGLRDPSRPPRMRRPRSWRIASNSARTAGSKETPKTSTLVVPAPEHAHELTGACGCVGYIAVTKLGRKV